jgi:hypothetical protein
MSSRFAPVSSESARSADSDSHGTLLATVAIVLNKMPSVTYSMSLVLVVLCTWYQIAFACVSVQNYDVMRPCQLLEFWYAWQM